MPLPDGFSCCSTHLIVSHLPQNNLIFWELGILVMCFVRRCGILVFPNPIKYGVGKKIPNAVLMYFLEFPYIQHVFLIVQALSLSAMECLRSVLLYGFKFRTAKVLMFDLDWCKLYGQLFPSSRIMQAWGKVENEKYLQFKVKLTFSSSTAPSPLSVTQQRSCQSNCQPLTVSPPLSIIVST